MTVEDRIALSGAPGSPYTRKMLALLRYRRPPHHHPGDSTGMAFAVDCAPVERSVPLSP